MLQPIKNCPLNNCLSINNPVRLSYNPAINRPRRILRRCPMILHSLRHNLNLLKIKPLPQQLILPNNPPGDQMMQIPPLTKSQIVIRRHNIHHIHIQPPTQITPLILHKQRKNLQTLPNHTLHVRTRMSPIKPIIPRHNHPLNISHQIRIQTKISTKILTETLTKTLTRINA